MLFRIVASPLFLAFVALGILVGGVTVLEEQVRFLLANHHMNFIPREVELETEIVILIATYGVLLEHRYWIVAQIYGEHVPAHERELDRKVQHYGVSLILLAVLLELTGAFSEFLSAIWPEAALVKFSEIGLLFLFNALTVGAVVLCIVRLARQPVR